MPQVQTRFLLLSDTHARSPRPSTPSTFPYRWPLPEADVAIHAGDLTMNGKISEHEQAALLLKSLPVDLKIVIPGNHDITLDTAYYAEKGGLWGPQPKYTAEQLHYIRSMYTNLEAQKANIVYIEEGTRTIHLKNGARLTIYASAYTPEFCNWAFAYPRDQDRFNSTAAGVENSVARYSDCNVYVSPGADTSHESGSVDVMITHGPPFGILDKVERNAGAAEDVHAGCEHLLRATSRMKPLLHCFGHIHEGWGAVRKIWMEGVEPINWPMSQDVATDCSPVVVDHQDMLVRMGVLVDSTKLQRGKETLFVNSSIMDVHYNPVQGPWIVDLMLEPSM